jgi:hypothetical protein
MPAGNVGEKNYKRNNFLYRKRRTSSCGFWK